MTVERASRFSIFYFTLSLMPNFSIVPSLSRLTNISSDNFPWPAAFISQPLSSSELFELLILQNASKYLTKTFLQSFAQFNAVFSINNVGGAVSCFFRFMIHHPSWHYILHQCHYQQFDWWFSHQFAIICIVRFINIPTSAHFMLLSLTSPSLPLLIPFTAAC